MIYSSAAFASYYNLKIKYVVLRSMKIQVMRASAKGEGGYRGGPLANS